jgi:hypothetical protein
MLGRTQMADTKKTARKEPRLNRILPSTATSLPGFAP